MRLTQFGESQQRLHRLFGEAGWVLFGQVSVALAALVSVRLLTELMAANQYGQFTLLISMVTLVFGLACRNVMLAGMRFRADYSEPAETAALRLVTSRIRNWALAAGVAVLGVGGAVFGTEVGLPPWIGLLMGLVLVSDVLRTYETSLLNAARRQRILSIWSAIEAWGRPLAAGAILLTIGGGASAVLVAYGTITLLISLVFGRLIALEGRGAIPRPVEGAQESRPAPAPVALQRRVITYMLPLMPIPFMNWTQSVGDRYLIAGLIGLEEAGLYAATYGLVAQPFLMVTAFLDTWLRPRFFESVAKGEAMARDRIFLFWLVLAAAIGTFGVLCFHFLHEWVASILLAEDFRHVSYLMPWIAAGYACHAVLSPFLKFCFAYEKTNYVLIVRTVTAIATVAIAVPLISTFGLMGAAYAVPGYFGAQLVAAIIAGAKARRDADNRGYGGAAA